MSKIKNADRPAMSFQEVTGMINGIPTGYKNHIGMTKREQFAMAAMQGILSNGVDFTAHDDKDVAQAAVIHADNLLAELERTK